MDKIKDIPCVILAGGKSSRMGEDKSLMPFGKYDTMIEYQYDKLSKIFDNIYISAKNEKFDFLKKMNNKNRVKLIIDNDKDNYSPLLALKTILSDLSYKKIFIITVDTPLVEEKTILSLLNYAKKNDTQVVVAKDLEKIHYLCGVFSNSIKFVLLEKLSKNIHKIKSFLNDINNYKELEFKNSLQFININDIKYYTMALNIINKDNNSGLKGS